MVTKFHACPNNVVHKPSMGVYFYVYECQQCRQCYCHKCGDRCPSCGSKERKKVGEVWKD